MRQVAISALLAAAGAASPVMAPDTPPMIVRHVPPPASVDFAPFENAGCVGKERICESGPLLELGCDRIAPPPDLLANLRPSFPVAHCFVEPRRRPDTAESIQKVSEEGFLHAGEGRRLVFVRLVLLRDGRFERIATHEELRDAFAPIESDVEALAYALAATGLLAVYDLEYRPDYEYFVDRLEETHVVTDGAGGYRVHLFHKQVFGCGPKPVSAVEVSVSRAGIVNEENRTPLFKDPRADQLCWD